MPDAGLLEGPSRLDQLGSEILALVGDSVICTDDQGRIRLFNRSAEQAFGYAASEVVGRHVEMLLPERHRVAHARMVRSFAREEGSFSRLMGTRREVCGRRKGGEEFPAEAMVSRLTIKGDVFLTVVVRDITERKELEEQREVIARELDHRVRNALSVVNSLVRLSARDARGVEQFKETLLGRLSALANTQTALRFGAHRSASLSELLSGELDQYRSHNGLNIVIRGADVALTPKAAQNLALMIHELATNAAKYGALSVADGRVAVTSAQNDEDGVRTLFITWRETGGSAAKSPGRQGFGTTLLKQIISATPGAKLETVYSEKGLACSISMPSRAVEAASPAIGQPQGE